MAISLDYSPISAALRLGQQAGEGDRRKQQAQSDLAVLNYGLNAQGQMDDNHAREIGLALQADNMHADNQRANDQLKLANARYTAEDKYKYDQLNALNQYRDNSIGLKEDNAAALGGYREKALGVRQQQADASTENAAANTVRANTPHASAANHDTQTLEQEHGRLSRQEAFIAKQMKQFSFDPNDPTDLLAQPSQSVQGAKAGFEARYADAKNTLSAVQQRRQQIEEGLKQRIDPLLNQQTQAIPAPSAPVTPGDQAQSPQSAPSQPRIVQTATNPQTGQRIGFDATTGQWVAI